MLRLRLTPYSENPTWTWSGACYGTLDQRSRIESSTTRSWNTWPPPTDTGP